MDRRLPLQSDTTGIVDFSQAEIENLIQQLESTGRYSVHLREPDNTAIDSNTSGAAAASFVPGYSTFGTPTPVREAARMSSSVDRHVSFGHQVDTQPGHFRHNPMPHTPDPHFRFANMPHTSDTNPRFASTGMHHTSVPQNGFANAPAQRNLYESYTPVSGSGVGATYNDIQPQFDLNPVCSGPLLQNITPVASTQVHSLTPHVTHTPSVLPPQNNFVTSTPAPSYANPHHLSAVPIATGSRIPSIPPFSGEGKKDESDFEVWKYDVTCLLQEGVYPQYSLLEAIRRSLRGKARSALFHLGPGATVHDIIAELEGIYGNVSSTENLKEVFYSARQRPDESLADYSLRLEQLLCRSNLHLAAHQKNDMLCSKLWSGLYDQNLKHITRFKYETISDFGQLRRELRQVEQEIRGGDVRTPCATASPQASSVSFTSHATIEEATSNLTLVESKLLKQLETLTAEMKQMSNRLSQLEIDKKNSQNQSKKDQDRDQRKDQNRDSEEKRGDTRSKPLNPKGPPRKGR